MLLGISIPIHALQRQGKPADLILVNVRENPNQSVEVEFK